MPTHPNDRPSLDDPVEETCDAFERAFHEGLNPKIEEFVNDVPQSVATELLIELLNIEIELRQREGEKIVAEDYEKRFPECASLIREILPNTDQDRDTAKPVNTKADFDFETTHHNNASRHRFSHFELINEVGRGGMGVVYRAIDLRLSRVVALKMILCGEFAGEEMISRFQSEARAAALLDHPGIVPIYDVGEFEGQRYFSMAFVEGENLADRIQETTLSNREAADTIRQLADAIAYAHSQGVVHRDLKPANIILDQAGHPRITDFGLAKHVEDDNELTATGQVLGTPGYMAPEQASGDHTQVGVASDIYGLGAILYCSLTGRPPFKAATVSATLRQVIDHEPISPRQLNPLVDIDLETICLKCLSKEPRRRFVTAKELSADLDRYLQGVPVQARPVSTAEKVLRVCKRHPTATILLAVVLVLVMILAVVGPLTAINQRQLANSARRSADAADIAREKQVVAAELAESLRIKEAAARDDAEKALKRVADAERLARSEAESANQVAHFLTQLFRESDPIALSSPLFGVSDSTSANQTAREILDRGANRILDDLSTQPIVQAKLMTTIGEVYVMIGAVPQAQELLLRAKSILEGETQSTSMATLSGCLYQLGILRAVQGDFDESVKLLRQAISIRTSLFGESSRETVAAKLALVWPLAENGYAIDDKDALAEARRLAESVLKTRLNEAKSDHVETATAQVVLGIILFHEQNPLGSMSYLNSAQSTFLQLGLENNLATSISLLIKSEIAKRTGQLSEAARYANDALEMVTRLLGDEHPFSIILEWHIARIVSEGNPDRRLSKYREILSKSLDIPGRPLRNSELMLAFGQELRRHDQLDEAEEWIQKSHRIRLAELEDDHWRVADTISELGRLERDRGAYDLAEQHLREGFEIYLANGLIDRRWHGAKCSKDLKQLLKKLGKHQSVAALQETIDAARDRN